MRVKFISHNSHSHFNLLMLQFRAIACKIFHLFLIENLIAVPILNSGFTQINNADVLSKKLDVSGVHISDAFIR